MTTNEERALTPQQTKAVVQWKGGQITITFHDVKKLICPLATDQETAVFLKTCQSLQLNPFAKEIHLIKYNANDNAAMVIAIDAYLKACEINPNYDGHEAGIILRDSGGKLDFRDDAFLLDEERPNLVGSWAKVYRKDRSRAVYVAVHKAECIKYTKEGKPTKFWHPNNQPWMLRKVALKRALVEAFPSLFAGTLATAEVSGEVEGDFHEIPEGTLPPGLTTKDGKPNWSKVWPKIKSELGLTKEEAHQLLNVKSFQKDLIEEYGWTMEQVWETLLKSVQRQQAPFSEQIADAETGEIITQDEELFGEDTVLRDSEDEASAGAPAEVEVEQPIVAPTPAKPKRDPKTIHSINDLTRTCFEDFNLQPNDVYKELGYSSAKDISDTPAECYRKIAAVRG